MNFQCATPSGTDLCLFGGTCVFASSSASSSSNPTTTASGTESCACPAGFSRDDVLFHQPNCALPSTALGAAAGASIAFAALVAIASAAGVASIRASRGKMPYTALEGLGTFNVALQTTVVAFWASCYVSGGSRAVSVMAFHFVMSFALYWSEFAVQVMYNILGGPFNVGVTVFCKRWLSRALVFDVLVQLPLSVACAAYADSTTSAADATYNALLVAKFATYPPIAVVVGGVLVRHTTLVIEAMAQAAPEPAAGAGDATGSTTNSNSGASTPAAARFQAHLARVMRFRHGVMIFTPMLACVSLVLVAVPAALKSLPMGWVAMVFLTNGLVTGLLGGSTLVLLVRREALVIKRFQGATVATKSPATSYQSNAAAVPGGPQVGRKTTVVAESRTVAVSEPPAMDGDRELSSGVNAGGA